MRHQRQYLCGLVVAGAVSCLAAAPAAQAGVVALPMPTVTTAVPAVPDAPHLPALARTATSLSRVALSQAVRALPRLAATGGAAIPIGPVVRLARPPASSQLESRLASPARRTARRGVRTQASSLPAVPTPMPAAGGNAVVIIRIDSPGNDGSIVQINGATRGVTVDAPTLDAPTVVALQPGATTGAAAGGPGQPAGSGAAKWVWNWNWCGAPLTAALATTGSRQWTWNWASSCSRESEVLPDVGIPAGAIPGVGTARARAHPPRRRVGARSARILAGASGAVHPPAAFAPDTQVPRPGAARRAVALSRRHPPHRGRASLPPAPEPGNGFLTDLPASSVTVSPGGSGTGGLTLGLVVLVGLAIVMAPVGRRRRGHFTVPEALRSSRLERPG